MFVSSSLSRYEAEFKKSAEYAALTPSQKLFSSDLFSGHNIFLSGEAGTGKSFVVQAVFNYLLNKGISIGRTSSTGVSAFNIGGQTLHSWLGCGLAQEDVQTLIEKIKKNKRARARMDSVQLLIIDEVSMIKGEFLDKVDMIMKYFRYSQDPFGGAQVVVCGDALQLSPVFKKNDGTEQFFFESRAWKDGKFKARILTEQVRQSDPSFISALNRARIGDQSDFKVLLARMDAKFENDGIDPIRIFCKNVEVDSYNAERLHEIKGESQQFYAHDTGLPFNIEKLDKDCPASKRIQLKIGAQVGLTCNLDTEAGFVNGSIGKVVAFEGNSVRVKFKSGEISVIENKWELKEQEVGADGKIKYVTIATRTQIPLRLAYATTVHRSQGLTLDRAIIDFTGSWASPGMHYTSLSRVKDLGSMSLTGFDPKQICVSQKCIDFYKNLST